MTGVVVVGTGMTRFGKFPDATLKSMTAEAVGAALADAGAQPGAVQAAYAANAIAGLLTGQEMVRGQVALRAMGGFGGIPTVNVENACAGGSTALHLAWTAVASGSADMVLAFGAEKMTSPDKRRALDAIATAMDIDESAPSGQSPFMAAYADKARRYLKDADATPADFAAVAVKAQNNGARNPLAQYGSTAVTVEDVLGSPMIAAPLTRLMCAPIGDGAAAVLLASPAMAARLGADAVTLRASVLASGADAGRQPRAIDRAVRRAYELAGLGPSDLDVVELHDSNAPAEVLRYESLGLAAPFAGVGLVRDGVTRLGGRLPVNPSGGLLARGHPIGATGLAQVVELVQQLRGRAGERQVQGARVALAENGGGSVAGDAAAECVHILTR